MSAHKHKQSHECVLGASCRLISDSISALSFVCDTLLHPTSSPPAMCELWPLVADIFHNNNNT